MVTRAATPKNGRIRVHEHTYKAKDLNRMGVALRCSCGARAQFYPVWNKPERSK